MIENPQAADKPKLHRLERAVAMFAPLLILAVPSLWLMVEVSPLWREVDAYVQTVFRPGTNTILRHAPLYCVLSRVPLWLGYLASGAGSAIRVGGFIKHTQLTDLGAFALVLAQHANLWWAAMYFINSITTTYPSRF